MVTVTEPRKTQRRLALEITGIFLLIALAFGAATAGGAYLYRTLYSPSAFVTRYLDLLAAGRAADALALPGVAVDAVSLADRGLDPTVSDALLRQAALSSLSNVSVVSEEAHGDITRVTVEYVAGGHEGKSTFDVATNGWLGVAPTWRFASSPLGVVNVAVNGSMQFDVNGFVLDKRQVSALGVDADPQASVPFLVFSPGLYSVSVDTAVSATPGISVLMDAAENDIPVTLQAKPTDEFVTVVQDRVEEFLDGCAAQQVLQPTGCPFGYFVQDRIVNLPVWSVAQHPAVVIEPDGAGWKIPSTAGVAHLEVDIQSLYDGEVSRANEDVDFTITGDIDMLPDGTASIRIGN